MSRLRGSRRVKGYLGLGTVYLIRLGSLRLDMQRLHKPGAGTWALYCWQERNGMVVFFPLWGKNGSFQDNESLKYSLILDTVGVWRIPRQEKEVWPFCGLGWEMAWGEKEVVNDNRPNVLRGKDWADWSETVRACMARQQGTWAACGASGCQHLVCGYYLKQQPTAGLVCVKEDVSDRCCQTSELLMQLLSPQNTA